MTNFITHASFTGHNLPSDDVSSQFSLAVPAQLSPMLYMFFIFLTSTTAILQFRKCPILCIFLLLQLLSDISWFFLRSSFPYIFSSHTLAELGRFYNKQLLAPQKLRRRMRRQQPAVLSNIAMQQWHIHICEYIQIHRVFRPLKFLMFLIWLNCAPGICTALHLIAWRSALLQCNIAHNKAMEQQIEEGRKGAVELQVAKSKRNNKSGSSNCCCAL